MKYDKEKLSEAAENIKKLVDTSPLPQWEMLPGLELYMDQVIILLNQYLNIFASGNEEGKFLTPPMINNYVKLKLMPAPVKKKYGRIHLAYLIIICILKQTLGMSTIQKLIPAGLSEEEIKNVYTSFIRNHNTALMQISKKTITAESYIKEGTDEASEKITDFVMQTAISSGLSKLLIEKLTNSLNNQN